MLFIASTTLYGYLLGNSTENWTPTYDEMKVRIQRVKNDMINRLKNDKNTEDKDSLIKQIEACEIIEKDYFVYKPIIRIVADFVFSKGRQASDMYNLHRQLEEFAANPLFVKSAKLSLMA